MITMQLISALFDGDNEADQHLVFATWEAQYLYFLSLQPSSVADIIPGQKSYRKVFL